MDTNESFALVWHSRTKGMISQAQKQNVFIEKVKHKEYYKNVDNQSNCYFSVNSFSPKRGKDKVFELIGHAVDIDFGKGEDVDEEKFVTLLELQEFGYNIPTPSYIVFSGHGLHVYWRYEESIPARTKTNQVKKKLIYMYEKICRVFAKILLDYGADMQATDVTRLLRESNTYNTKHGRKVKTYVIRNYNTEYSFEEYTLWLPKIEKREAKIKKLVSNITYMRNRYTLHYARLQDILKLAEIREYNCTGCRELMCFLTRYYSYLSTGDKQKAKETMLELNNKFTEPLRENRLVLDTKSAEKAVEKYLLDKAKGYNYSNKRLVEILDISEEEQKWLKTIILKGEANEREKVAKKLKRRNENALTSREQQKQELIMRITELKEQGLRQKDIAEVLKITKSVVSEILNGVY